MGRTGKEGQRRRSAAGGRGCGSAGGWLARSVLALLWALGPGRRSLNEAARGGRR